MDPMEIMIDTMDFRPFRLKTKQERIFYSCILAYRDSNSRRTNSLISLTDLADSQLTIDHGSSVLP